MSMRCFTSSATCHFRTTAYCAAATRLAIGRKGRWELNRRGLATPVPQSGRGDINDQPCRTFVERSRRSQFLCEPF